MRGSNTHFQELLHQKNQQITSLEQSKLDLEGELIHVKDSFKTEQQSMMNEIEEQRKVINLLKAEKIDLNQRIELLKREVGVFEMTSEYWRSETLTLNTELQKYREGIKHLEMSRINERASLMDQIADLNIQISELIQTNKGNQNLIIKLKVQPI